MKSGERLELLTDLYELTMAASYFENAMDDSATFSLFIRKFPPDRAYFVAAGLQDLLDFAANFHFSFVLLSVPFLSGLRWGRDTLQQSFPTRDMPLSPAPFIFICGFHFRR